MIPPWPARPADTIAAAVQGRARPALRQGRAPRPLPEVQATVGDPIRPKAANQLSARPATRSPRRAPTFSIPSIAPGSNVTAVVAAASPYLPPPAALPPGPAPASSRRWSLSAWTFMRRGDSAPLAAGGLLGGSQAGTRLTYRLNRDKARPLALSVRVSAPLRRAAGAEAALGLDWKPLRRVPVRLLAERRQALGREGRTAFGATFYGGVGDAPLGTLRIDAYAQAGLVGIRSRDLFGDGSIRVSLPLGERARVGAGAWAAAQPGLSRLDFGPQAALRLPVAVRALTLAADWRVRAAGNARPGSGPTLTLATDF